MECSSRLLEEGLVKLDLCGTVVNTAVKQLERYIEEIELFNSAYGLVKVRDREELIVKHILDSLAPLNIIRRLLDAKSPPADVSVKPRIPAIADVGSGAGLPGIPLAICMPSAEFTLIERMGRRAGFLRDVLAVLSLANVAVEETEMEKAMAGRFDIIVFRAFRPLEPAILRGLFRLLVPGGTIAAYKGRRETVEEEMAGLLKAPDKGLEDLSWEILPLEVPFLKEERHLLLIL